MKEKNQFITISKILSKGITALSTVEGKNIVPVIGKTAAGKSTLINYLLGAEMIRNEKGNVITKYPMYEVAKIGHGVDSETLYPSAYKAENGIFLCDWPGFDETRGPEESIITAMGIESAVCRAKQVLGAMIVIDYNDFSRNRGNGIRELTQTLSKIFSTDILKLNNSLLFLITKTPENYSENDMRTNILDKINGLIESKKHRLKNICGDNLNKVKQLISEYSSDEREMAGIDLELRILDAIRANSENILFVNCLDNGNSRNVILNKISHFNYPISDCCFNFSTYNKDRNKFDIKLHEQIRIVSPKLKEINSINSELYSQKKEETELSSLNNISIFNIDKKFDAWIYELECVKNTLNLEIKKLQNEMKHETEKRDDEVVYINDRIHERRNPVLGEFLNWGYTKKVFKFDSNGIAFTNARTFCDDKNGLFYGEKREFDRGRFQITYASNYGKEGEARVEILAKRGHLPENITHMTQLRSVIKEKENQMIEIKTALATLTNNKNRCFKILENSVHFTEEQRNDAERQLRLLFSKEIENIKIRLAATQNKLLSSENSLLGNKKERHDEIISLGIIIHGMKLKHSCYTDFLEDIKKYAGTEFLTTHLNQVEDHEQSTQNSAAKFFLYEKLDRFDKWYHPDICIYLLNTINNNSKCLRVLFDDVHEKDNTETFRLQLEQLVKLSAFLKRPAIFISKEPGAKNHFIGGLVTDGNLLLINPLGITDHDLCYQTLAEVQRDNIVKKIWLSSNALQKWHFEKEGLVSCGPITAELAIHILTNFTPEGLDNFCMNHLKVNEPTKHHNSGLVYYGIKINDLLPDTLKELFIIENEQMYIDKICSIRQKQGSQLHLLPIKDNNISAENYLTACKNSPAQVLFNLLVHSDSISNISETNEYKLLIKELELQPENLKTDPQKNTTTHTNFSQEANQRANNTNGMQTDNTANNSFFKQAITPNQLSKIVLRGIISKKSGMFNKDEQQVLLEKLLRELIKEKYASILASGNIRNLAEKIINAATDELFGINNDEKKLRSEMIRTGMGIQ